MDIQLTVITPVKQVLKESVDELIVQTDSGEITVLPSHIPLLTKVASGELTIKKGGKMSHFALTGGFMEVKENLVTILADYAVRAEDIEVVKAKEAQERAENTMKQKVSQRDFAIAEADLRRSIVELQVARRHRKSTS
ncbi:MAG TPA: F0F1 ATP synthase subunit epsilon [Patescibacteria group bacterium]|nr:F0F1 ATP synthase subunit epsilon [Patescibacteria group bacterium]